MLESRRELHSGASSSLGRQRHRGWLWVVLLLAFSPTIAELAGGLAGGFVPESVVLSPLLLVMCVLRGRDLEGARGPEGGLLVALGAALQLLGIYTDSWSLARLGLPAAVIGMSRYLGHPPVRVAALALGVVPLPDSLVDLYTPVPETALLSVVCGAWGALGLDVSCVGPVARTGDRSLELIGFDVGLPLAVVMAQLGWYAAVVTGAAWTRAIRRALAFAVATLLVQPLAVALAVALMATGAADLARAWLDHGVWLACATATVGVTLLRGSPGGRLSASDRSWSEQRRSRPGARP